MKAVILTGGEGTRLRAISGGLPKPMMPLLGTPLLERTVTLLRENGFDRLCLALHYRPQIIRDRLGDGSALGVHIEYRLEPTPLGTAGALYALKGKVDGGAQLPGFHRRRSLSGDERRQRL